MWNLFLKQNSKCALSGVDIILTRPYSCLKQSASLDRVDNTTGYRIGNVRWVHKIANRLKNALQDEELFEWCKRILKENEYS